MCLLVLAWQTHPRYRLVVAANRDEYHERPAAALERWPPPTDILAGRDLRAGGTWLGVNRARHVGVITNYRELQHPRAGAPSRGELIPQYLGGKLGAAQFFGALEGRADHYSGFSLLLTDDDTLWYGSNRSTPFARSLPAGVYALSNELLDTPWPKVQRVRAGFERWLADPGGRPEGLFALLNDRTRAPEDAVLPDTGVSPAWERVLSSPFVLNPDYGTRGSTVALMESNGALYLAERRFGRRGESEGETEFRLDALEWP